MKLISTEILQFIRLPLTRRDLKYLNVFYLKDVILDLKMLVDTHL